MDSYWLKSAKRTLIHCNKVKHIKPQNLTQVSCVKVCASPDRKIDDPVCSIYGEVSFQVGRSSTTLFRRERDNTDDFDLTDDESYLTFSDLQEPLRALPPVSPTTPLHVKMKLFEIVSPDQEDALIAEIDHWEAAATPPGLGTRFVLEGLNGFKFDVCYSVVFGCPVAVQAAIMEPGEGDSVMACQVIAYHYSLKDPPGRGLLPQTRALLASVYSEEPMTVEAFKSIDLERKLVVAPIREGQFLSILLRFEMNGDDLVRHCDVHFPLMQLWNEETQSLWASEDMTHIKAVLLPKYLTKLVFSITFLPDLLEEVA